MPISARDHAAALLLEFERRPGFVRNALAARRDSLSDPRDRGLLTELVYGVIRHRGTLDAVLDRISRRPATTLHMAVRTGLRLGLYQVLFLDRVPAHAAVDHAVSWTRGIVGAKRAGFVNGVLRGALRALEGRATGADDPRRDVPREDGSRIRFSRVVFADPEARPARCLAQRFSMPEWLVARWLDTLGKERTEEVLRTGISRPGFGVRARGDVSALEAQLRGRGLHVEQGPVAGSLILPGGEGEVLDEVEAGSAAIQDVTAQRVAPLLRAPAGGRVLDLCAAPGGKTLHVADLMERGEIVAADVDPEKVAALARLDVRTPGITVVPCEVPADGPLPFEPESFDAVLVDAPCTNTGVLRRRVEARWRLKVGDVAALAAIQRDLLERALPLVKPGGVIVYATCSLEREENEDVVEAFSAAHPEIPHEIAFRVFPGHGQDGGFAAVFEKGR